MSRLGVISQHIVLKRTNTNARNLAMNTLLLGISFALISSLNGLQEENTYLDKEPVDLEALPLKKLLEMKKELQKREFRPAVRRTSAFDDEIDTTATLRMPDAMALRRTDDLQDSAATVTGSSTQTAFQMSLTVLSFLAFGGYVISLITQNMRRVQQMQATVDNGATAPQRLKTVVVNHNRRWPGLTRPTVTTVSYARRKRGSGFT